MTTPSHPRRWLTFSLRSFFVLLTVLTAWFGWNLHQVRQREVVLQHMRQPPLSTSAQYAWITPQDKYNYQTKPWRSLPFMWSLLGAEPMDSINLNPNVYSEDDRQYIQRLFPEATILRQ
jgi:hypothetical protein